MADFGQIMSQISNGAYQMAATFQGVSGMQPNGTIAPMPGMIAPTMVPDLLHLSTPAVPVVPAPTQISSGFMAALSTVWSKIVGFIKGLFGGNAAAAPAIAAASGVTTANATNQLFAMLPVGSGMALGLVPVSAHREGSAYFVSAAGFGSATVFQANGGTYYSMNNQPPIQVTQVTSTRAANGDTHFAIQLANGDHADADILADGHTLHFKNYTLTLA